MSKHKAHDFKPLSNDQQFVNALRGCLGLGPLYHRSLDDDFKPEVFAETTNHNSGRRGVRMRVPYAYTDAEQEAANAAYRKTADAPKARTAKMKEKNSESVAQAERVGRQYRQPRAVAS